MFRTFFLVAALAAAQKPTVDSLLTELDSVRPMSGVSISPDGHWVTWIEASSDLYLVDRTDAAAKPVQIAGTRRPQT